MLFKNKKREVWDELIVLGVFVAVCTAGLVYLGYISLRDTAVEEAPRIVVASAPSPEDYRKSCREIVRPFFEQVQQMTVAGIEAGGDDLAALASKTQERLLRLRVPSGERDAHLQLVLLLDKWKRAGQGSVPDRSDVLSKTQELLASYTWIMQ